MFSTEIDLFTQTHHYPYLRPKAVFFDMDGVLFDSMKHHATAWVNAMTEVGLPFSRQEAYMNEGRTGSSTINSVFEVVHGRSATEEEKKNIYRLKSEYFDACGQSDPMPYAYDLLMKIKEEGLDIFVVTGSGQLSLLDKLEHHFPNIFVKEKMVTAYDVKLGKPHPEPYLMALKKAEVQPWEVVVIENAPLGVRAGSAAGMFTIGINTGPLDPKVLEEYGANVVLRGMRELYECWDTFYESVKS